MGLNNIPTTFFPFQHNRVSISPPNNDSDELANWSDSPPKGSNYNTSLTALSEDNERLRRSNNMLMSELAHMKKLYNDIIYFVQNHVKPVAPSSTYPPFLLCNNTPQQASAISTNCNNASMVQKPMNPLLGCYSSSNNVKQPRDLNSPTNTSRSSITIVEEPSSNSSCKTKLFGVSLQSKKRVHPEYGSNNFMNSETNKARLVLENDDDLGLNLMPPSTC